ncbi:hypothetical protein LPTSP3_g30860 [Leptospira kobayashii]|uniref:Uncharacterized protein n=1 Tax=Leptospira kobayashii TaxID=1917830 RepID=A0ABN6KJN4_9LEPT|nr:hypothetical protein [Leptospira kobayashii]BDA80156.1 hypothetical protein LPTSP3_g30860 [Leptospira kobayashii]
MSIFEIMDMEGDHVANSGSLHGLPNDGSIELQLIDNFDTKIEFPFQFIRTNNTDQHYPGISVNVKYIAKAGSIEENIKISKYSRV